MRRVLTRWRIAPMLLVLSACHMWKTVPGAPADAIAATNPARVRISTADGRTLTLTAVRVVGDSVVGFDTHDARVALLLSRVYRVEIQPSLIDWNGSRIKHDPPIGH